jgi:dipeptidyl aminopeptidase/acylaminoacyl peptidase
MVGILSGHPVNLPMNLVDIQYASVRRISDNKFAMVGSRVAAPAALYTLDMKSRAHAVLRSITSISLPETVFSKSRAISFPRTHGQDKSGLAHAIFMAPHNPDFVPVPGTKPPLIVYAHGGPTASASPGLSLVSQYWTSRGYAYVSVNYAGSVGYGRAYRESLNSFWGIKDVDDCASCVAYLAENGVIDGSKVGITGQSSGGYTVLQSLCTYPELFTAGSSQYGISNLTLLAEGTHKFESHYLFPLIFTKSMTPTEQEKIMHDRSPCYHAEKIKSPLLLLQGVIDKVVPLDQALAMEKVLKEGGKDVTLVMFEGEGHGFRKEENVKRTMEEEEQLWRRTLTG